MEKTLKQFKSNGQGYFCFALESQSGQKLDAPEFLSGGIKTRTFYFNGDLLATAYLYYHKFNWHLFVINKTLYPEVEWSQIRFFR